MKDLVFFIITQRGKCNHILKEFHKIGVSGGTIMNAQGTAPLSFLNMLGLNKSDKELLIVTIKEEEEKEVIRILEDKFHFNDLDAGIGFSLPILRILNQYKEDINTDNNLHCLFIILDSKNKDRGLKALDKAGQKGATLIKARGAGVPKKMAVDFIVEPEKDVLLVLASSVTRKKVIEEIENSEKLSGSNRAFVFSVPVKETVGMKLERSLENGND